jgi:hypothetical protein
MRLGPRERCQAGGGQALVMPVAAHANGVQMAEAKEEKAADLRVWLESVRCVSSQTSAAVKLGDPIQQPKVARPLHRQRLSVRLMHVHSANTCCRPLPRGVLPAHHKLLPADHELHSNQQLA